MTRKTSLLFVINSLATGGAERQLCELARNLDKDRFEVHVVTLYDPGYHNGGELWPEMAAIPDVHLVSLRKRKGPLGYITALPRLFQLARRVNADLLHGYLQGNLAVFIVGHLLRKPIVWGVRRSFTDHTKLTRFGQGLLNTRIALSRFVDLAIFNSRTSLENHEVMGMRARRNQVIPNGFDVTRFVPDAERGRAQRAAWGIPLGVPLIGVVGRLDPVKDHPTFIRTAGRLAAKFPDARFVCVGRGSQAYIGELKAQAESLGIGDKVLFTGGFGDMPSAYNALSLLILSSTDEGFPNAVGEAMACGVPCVATRVGDAAPLVGSTGAIVDCEDDAALAEAAARFLSEPEEARQVRSQACRTRICETFSVTSLARRTEDELLSLLSPSPERVPRESASS